MSTIAGALFFNTLLVHGNTSLELKLQAVPSTEEVKAPYNTEELPIMHSVTYNGLTDYENYFVSEKLDGVRAFWNGTTLRSRQGILIQAPLWLLKSLPNTPLDGELWLGRGNFHKVNALVARNNPTDPEWRDVQYVIFDSPNHTGTFSERYFALKNMLPFRDPTDPGAPVYVLRQHQIHAKEQADNFYQDIISNGGEGIMYHHQFNYYSGLRTPYLLKRKPVDEIRARVIGYKPGQGKYSGQVGSLLVEDDEQQQFHVGSGLTDKLRNSPPSIGAYVCIRHSGLTHKNVPRFPRYVECEQ